MNKEELKGKGKQIEGTVRTKVGRLTGNRREEIKGQAEQVKGKVMEAKGRAAKAKR